MAEAILGFTITSLPLHNSSPASKSYFNPLLSQCSSSRSTLSGWQQQDPYYDSEQYRGDGGDGTGHWIYDKQEDIEEAARAELWREELIEEIEQKVGGLRELEEAIHK